MPLTIEALLKMGRDLLLSRGIDSARLDSELLLAFTLGKEKTHFIVYPGEEVPSYLEKRYVSYVKRRGEREPLAYITGEKEFWSLSFEVNPHTLIPRPDTEVLVEEAIRFLEKRKEGEREVVDIGVGSGAIAVVLVKEVPGVSVVAVDVSEGALEVAKRNARRMKVEKGIHFLRGSLLEPLKRESGFDLILSNPPYIPTKVIEGLVEDVRCYEPRGALDGGEDGLRFYRELIGGAPFFLKAGGGLMVEVGYDQGEAVAEILKKSGKFEKPYVIKDLSHLNRVVKTVRKS